MVDIKTEPVRSSDWLRHFTDCEFTFEAGTLKGGHQGYPSGTVLSQAADLTYKIFNGTDPVRAILRDPVAANTNDLPVAVVVADAIVTTHHLNWDASVNAADQKTALTALKAFNIKVRGDA